MEKPKYHPIGDDPETFPALITRKISDLPKNEKDLLNFDSPNIRSAAASVSGVILNIVLKRSLNIFEGSIATMLVSGFTATLSQFGLSKVLVQTQMIENPEFCGACVEIRSGVIQGASATFVPLAASLAVNAIIADRYSSVHIPSLTWQKRKEAWNFWRNKLRPTKLPFMWSFGLQMAFGMYIAYKQTQIMYKVHDTVTAEERKAVFSAQIHKLKGFEDIKRAFNK